MIVQTLLAASDYTGNNLLEMVTSFNEDSRLFLNLRHTSRAFSKKVLRVFLKLSEFSFIILF